MKLKRLKVENYRTIENLDLDFTSAYTAVCGPNDSGKTNVIRAVRSLMHEEDGAFSPGQEQISVKDDFPKWSEIAPSDRVIRVTASLDVHRDRDAGFYQFLVRQLSLEQDEEILGIEVAAAYAPGKLEPQVEVAAQGKTFSGIEAQEVLKRIRTSKSILFHNSTQPVSAYRNRSGFGQLKEIANGATILEEIKSDVDKKLKRLARGHQQEIESLLGRLEAKYKVGLSLPSLDFSWIPFDITLGESKFDVPLDNWGSGTQNRALILLTLFRAQRISESEASASKITPIIFIEEPESFLHPYAQAEFGRVLQDLAEEFQVQVVVTTHSPYLLSLDSPKSNLLLKRRAPRGQLRETQRVETAGEHWMEPFGQALGMSSEEFMPWRNLFGSKNDAILLVEGATDKEYFELLRKEEHGTGRLQFDGDIISYEGAGSLKNTVLLRFVKNRYKRVFVTYDLDVEHEVERSLRALDLEKGKDYCAIGVNSPGKKNIEGLLPDVVRGAVYSKNPDLVTAATGGTSEEQRRAKGELKRLLLREFKQVAQPGDHFKAFYAITKQITKAFA